MLAQLTFYLCCLGAWAFFHVTKGQQRYRWLRGAVWMLLAFGAMGFAAEVWMRKGGLPISW